MLIALSTNFFVRINVKSLHLRNFNPVALSVLILALVVYHGANWCSHFKKKNSEKEQNILSLYFLQTKNILYLPGAEEK